jgi:hypothetical protein
MKNIIDFIIDAEKNQKISKNFLTLVHKAKSYKDLKGFFDKNKYNVSDDECIRILENSSKFPDDGPVKEY